MMTDVSAMLSNFKYQMEAVKRQTAQNSSKANGTADIHSIVALMTELEAKLPVSKIGYCYRLAVTRTIKVSPSGVQFYTRKQ